MLRAAGLEKARLIAICIDNEEQTNRIVDLVQAEFAGTKIFARSFDRGHTLQLLAKNVDYELRETFESAILFGRKTLEAIGIDPDRAAIVEDFIRTRDRDRVAIQQAEGIYAGIDLMRQRPTMTPFSEPQHGAQALNEEAGELIRRARARGRRRMMPTKNILFIMCDQLRYDYLGCTGHPTLKTPNIDALAARGVRFTRAYVQSPICGPSRMSFYTGRYMRSHGSHWNGWPLRVGEPTLGDHLKKIGVRNVLVGKTHMAPDLEGLKMLGIVRRTRSSASMSSQCGFEPYERDDGLHPDNRPRPRYDAYLREHGFDAPNPWEQWANSGAGGGRLIAERLAARACRQGRTRAGGAFRDALHDAPRDGFHHRSRGATGGRGACISPTSSRTGPTSRPSPTPACTGRRHSARGPLAEGAAGSASRCSPPTWTCATRATWRAIEAREKVIPAYMGLIKQIDDQLGVLMRFLDERGLAETTMIVFTSDHGDYLGDHWMGEKDLFHEQSAKIPLIVVDPSRDADATRGTVNDALVEAIDLAPTFIDVFRRQGAGPHPRRALAACRCCTARSRRLAPAMSSPNTTMRCRTCG